MNQENICKVCCVHLLQQIHPQSTENVKIKAPYFVNNQKSDCEFFEIILIYVLHFEIQFNLNFIASNSLVIDQSESSVFLSIT